MLSRVRTLLLRIAMMIALAIAELQEFNVAWRKVIKGWLNKLKDWILLKYKCAKIKEKMCLVNNHKDWEKYARQLDHLEGTFEYKIVRESRYYDYKRIESRYRVMKQLRKKNNIKTLAHCLRQDLVKNIGGISDPHLYNQCFLGTKR